MNTNLAIKWLHFTYKWWHTFQWIFSIWTIFVTLHEGLELKKPVIDPIFTLTTAVL
jgi:hypothetical protein